MNSPSTASANLPSTWTCFSREKRVAVLVVDRPGVAEHPAEDVGEEVGEDLLLLERVGLGRPEQPSPAAEGLPHARYVAGQIEAGKARAENVGAEERLGFDGHGAVLARGPDAKEVLKPHFTQAPAVC